MGEEALGPVKAGCPVEGNVRAGRQEWVGGLGSTLIEAGGRGYDRRFQGKGDLERGQHLKCK